MFDRRTFVLGSATTLAVLSSSARAQGLVDFATELAIIEKKSGGRLGVSLLDPASGRATGHNRDQRFPMCSTFKLLAASAILARVDGGREDLARRIAIPRDGIVVNSPITGPRAGGEPMSLAEICEAAMVVSDNTAGNIMLDSLGGPLGLTAYLRKLGDDVTRLDRIEPDLNEALPDDPRDTTTPAAMATNIRKLLFGDALSQGSREQLTNWLLGNRTGATRMRAGMPKDWRVGDKTGTGERGTTNDVGLVWPAQRAPMIVTIYLTGASPDDQDSRNAVIASVGRLVAGALGAG